MQKPTLKERLKVYFKKKPNYVKNAKKYRYVSIVYGGVGLFCSFLGVYILSQISWLFKNGYWALAITESSYNNVSFLSIFSAVTLITMGVSVPILLFAVFLYTRSLQCRIKVLEEKLEVKP